MPKICVQSPEVVMSGAINIHAQVAIVTKAKLDAISVQGNCECGDAPPVITDYVIVIDGSDSFNNKVNINGQTIENDAFDETKKWASNLIDQITRSDKPSTVTLVQFSGIKQKEADYRPGSNGDIGSGLRHYKIEIAPTARPNVRDATRFDALDGNGQLFLCLQDLAMDSFTNRLNRALDGQQRQTVLIIVSDEEWDCKKLQNAFGSGITNPEQVCAAVHKKYNAVHAVVVRPNEFNDQNEPFIKNTLCRNSNNYHKVYTKNFDSGMNQAGNRILRSLGYKERRSFF